MALPVTLIESTDTLESGFRAKANGNFNSIVVDGEVDVDGNLVLQSTNGHITVPLSDTFATKGYASNVASTPPASEITSGRARLATDVEVIAGTNDSTIVTPLKLTQKFEDYFSKATHLADASDFLQIGNDASVTELLGQFGFRNFDNYLGSISATNLTENINYVLPNFSVEGVNVLNDWNYLINKPTTFPAEAHTHTFASLTSKPTTISGFGITDFETNWQYLWVDRIGSFVEFGSDVGVLGGLGVSNALFVGGAFYDKNSYAGIANQVLMPVTGGVAWTSLLWSHITDKPTTFTPTAHFHTIGDITDLSTSLAGKQPLNANLTSLAGLGTVGIVRLTGTNTFGIGTNDPITLSGDVTGTGTTAITTTLANSGVTAGTYRSVTVDVKGRVTAGTNPTTIAGYGITDFNDTFDVQFAAKIRSNITFESYIIVEDYLSVVGSFYVNANLYDKNGVEGTANQVLMPITGGVAWTSLSTAQISDFSANVLGQVLTGYVIGSNTAITSSDTILTAFQNVQAQINAKASTLSGTTNYLSKFNSSSAIGNSQIFDDGTNVGIGFPNSVVKLDIRINAAGLPSTIGTTQDNAGLRISSSATGGIIDFGLNGANNWIQSTDRTDLSQGYNLLLNPNGGNVGIGTTTPTVKLESRIINVGVAATSGTTQSNAAFRILTTASTGIIDFGLNGANNWIQSTDRTDLSQGYNLLLNPNGGFVAIGQTTAAYNLDVNGTGHFVGAVLFDAIPSCAVTATTANHLVNLATVQSLVSAGFSVSTACVLAFTTDQSLSGAKTQGGYTTVTGDSILLTNQSSASANGVYIFDGTNWARNTANDTDTEIRGKGHLILNGTYANTQWVNNNSSTITVGSTAITYVQWSGAELDPVFTAHAAYNVTNTKISNWDSAYSNHVPQSRTIAIAGSGRITVSVGTQDLSANRTWTLDLPTTGVTAGTYPMVTVDVYGRVTASSSTIEISNVTGLQTNLDNKHPLNASLTAITDLNTNGFIKRTGTGTYAIDTTSYLPLSGGTLSGALQLNYSVRIGANNSDNGNLYFGKATMSALTAGMFNTAIGTSAAGGLTTGQNNTFLGYSAGSSITTGTGNILVGVQNTGITTGNYNVIIGRSVTSLSSSLSNNIIIADGQGNRRINVNSTGLVGFGLNDATYRVDVSGDVNVTGMYRLNGSIGADHAFLKSNGTTQEWSLLTVGEISDIDTVYASKVYSDLNYIKRVTDEGERGFYLYGDTANTVKEAFLFTNPDTGIVGIHAYRLNGSTIEQYGYQLTKEGLPYWLFADGSRKRILTENDAVGGGGGTIGGTVTSDLNFGVQRNIFWRNPGITDPNNFAAKLFWQGAGSYSSSIFTEGASGMVFEAATNLNIGTTQDLKLKGQKIYWNGIEINMSTFGINKYLRATSSTKAEWVV